MYRVFLILKNILKIDQIFFIILFQHLFHLRLPIKPYQTLSSIQPAWEIRIHFIFRVSLGKQGRLKCPDSKFVPTKAAPSRPKNLLCPTRHRDWVSEKTRRWTVTVTVLVFSQARTPARRTRIRIVMKYFMIQIPAAAAGVPSDSESDASDSLTWPEQAAAPRAKANFYEEMKHFKPLKQF